HTIVGESKLLVVASATTLAAGVCVDLDEARCGSNPHGIRTVIGERKHGHAAERSAAIVTEQPAVGIPVTRTAVTRADPQHAAAILVERRDAGAAQALRIVFLASVTDELARGSIEQVEPIARRHPQAVRVVFQHSLNAIVAQRARDLLVMAKRSNAA